MRRAGRSTAEPGADAGPADLDALIGELDHELARTGIRGNPDPGKQTARRHRSTRRRQDAPDLPRRKISPRTTGKVYTAPDGKTFRPSMFLTLTCDSYGKVTADGVPADPESYDYQRAARDALHFAALFDRFIQNLRRFLGYDLQYFAAIEPQRRLAPHVHLAMRGTVSRAELRQVIAATYHQAWWPSTDEVRFDGDRLPEWHEASGNYLDPATGEVLPTWDQALDNIGPNDAPRHVARFGPKFDAQGVLAGSKDSGRCIRYLTKYLTKHISGCHQADTNAQADHADRLMDALRYEPCSPGCANWLRYGIQPKDAREGLRPGACKGKAHRREHLGYAGRRVLVSRKWSGKTLADHRGDRKAWLLSMLDLPATDERRYRWEPVTPGDAGLHAAQQTAPARPRRPRPMASRPHPSQTKIRGERKCFGNREGSMTATQVAPLGKQLYRVPEAMGLLSISRSVIYEQIRSGRLRSVTQGRMRLIPASAITDYIALLEREARAA